MQITNKSEKHLYIFFLIAFAWSWLLWLPEAIWSIKLYLAPFGPTIAAFILTYASGGLDGAKKLLKRGIDFSFGKIWLIPIFLLMPTIIGLSFLLAILSGEPAPEMGVLSQPWIIIPAFFYILFLGGPMAEEFGWRGYALDRLQTKYNALISSIILGIIWGLWHLPLFFMKGQEIYRNVPILGFILGTVLLSILFTWIYNNTGRSILAVLLFHTMGNLSHFIFPTMATSLGGLYSLILNIIAVIIILIIWGPEKMIRRQYQQNHHLKQDPPF
ncbi:MAG: type II CAAX endopeptidase family protein [Methanothermobacter sp.]|nr:type II CAAX endopeptidase family protein [Methanothermobacter sp.]